MINAYCTDNIIIINTSYNKWGSATERKIIVKGRISFRTKLVRSLSGEQIVSPAKVIIPKLSIDNKDKVIYNNREYSILNIEEIKDFSKQYLKLDLA